MSRWYDRCKSVKLDPTAGKLRPRARRETEWARDAQAAMKVIAARQLVASSS